MGSEVQKRLHKVASLVLEMRLASPGQVAKGLAACEEGRAKDLVEWLERERVLNPSQRALLEERLGRLAEPAPGAARDDEGLSTLVEASEKPISPDTRRPPSSTAVATPQAMANAAASLLQAPPLPTRPRAEPAGGTPPRPASPAPMNTLDGHAGHRSRAPSTAAPLSPSHPPEEAGGDLLAPETPGRYVFVRVHASGGQARVLLCRDEHVGRDVAIKEIHPDELPNDTGHRSTSVEAQRLLREARVTGQLEHPNIVPVYDLGRRKDGALYYSMRFVRGTTLAEKLKAAKTLQDRLRLLRPFMDICSAVAYAHSRGVIHRDLKPSNAMVGEFGETVLLDWGIAKVRGKRDIRAVEIANESKLMRDFAVAETVDGAAIGTPAYMSPEQAAGQVDEIDERSDVWGLGAILYQILTGKPPNAGKTQAELITSVLEGRIQPVLGLCAEAPPELAAICEKALRKEKNRRYKTAKDIADEVETWLTGGRVTAYRYSSWELLRRFAEQNKKTMAAAGFILLVILGALVAVTFALSREQTARAAARHESLEANFQLAGARVKAAEQKRLDFKFVSAAGLAAESLMHNPAHPKAPFFDAAYAAGQKEAQRLLVQAASTVYQTRGQSFVDLTATFKAEEVLTQVAYSPDGARVAVGSYDGKVRIWDTAQRLLWKTLDGKQDRVYSVAYSPDGRLLASGGRDRRIVLWDAATGAQVRSLEGHENLVRQVAFSADGALLASASWDRTVRLWEVDGGRQLRVLPHDDQVLCVAFSPDGRFLASGGNDRQVHVWRLPALEPVTTISAYTSEVMALAFSPDGRSLATGSNERSIHVFATETGRPLQVMEVSSGMGGIWALAYSPDGRFLASAGFDKTVRLWDARSGSPLITLEAHAGTAAGVAFSPQGDALATAGYDRLLKLWRLRRLDNTQLSGHSAYVYGLAYSPGGRRVATGGADKTVRVWDVTTGQAVMTLDGHGNMPVRLSFSPDGALLASAARERLVILWDMKEGRALLKMEQPSAVYDVAFSPDGKLLAMAGSDKLVRVFDAHTLTPRATLAGHEAALTCLAFSPDSQRLATGGQDKTIRVWDLASGKTLQTLRGHSDWVWSLDFSQDGRRLVSSGKDGLAILWDGQTGAELRRLDGHGEWVNRARFSPDGTLVVTGSDDQTARVWDVATGQAKLILHATREVAGTEFSPDGRTVAVADGNTVRLYPVDFSVLEADPALLLEEARKAGYQPEGP